MSDQNATETTFCDNMMQYATQVNPKSYLDIFLIKHLISEWDLKDVLIDMLYGKIKVSICNQMKDINLIIQISHSSME